MRAVERRAALVAGLPAGAAQVEPMQVVRYRFGEYYQPHHDGEAGNNLPRPVSPAVV